MNISLISMVNQIRFHWSNLSLMAGPKVGISGRPPKKKWGFWFHTQVPWCPWCFDRYTTFWESPFLSWQILFFQQKTQGFWAQYVQQKRHDVYRRISTTFCWNNGHSHQPYQQNTAVRIVRVFCVKTEVSAWRLKFPILKYVTWQTGGWQWKTPKSADESIGCNFFGGRKPGENHQWSFRKFP